MHEMASLVMFWVENSLIKTLICVGRLRTDTACALNQTLLKAEPLQTEPLLLEWDIEWETERDQGRTRVCSFPLQVSAPIAIRCCIFEIYCFTRGNPVQSGRQKWQVLNPLHSTSKLSAPLPRGPTRLEPLPCFRFNERGGAPRCTKPQWNIC